MTAVQDEIFLYITYTLIPIGSFAALLFLWNLLCAPYRIEKDAHNNTKNKLSNALKQIPSKRVRRLTDDHKCDLANSILDLNVHGRDRIAINYFRASGECADFANDIADAVMMANLDVAMNHNIFSAENPARRGITITHGSDWDVSELAKTFHKCFVGLGFLCSISRVDTLNTFNIYVARAPE